MDEWTLGFPRVEGPTRGRGGGETAVTAHVCGGGRSERAASEQPVEGRAGGLQSRDLGGRAAHGH